jgi:hypothetical protein
MFDKYQNTVENYIKRLVAHVDEYALIDVGLDVRGKPQYALCHKPTWSSVIIEDDEMSREVEQQLLLAGVQILDVETLKKLMEEARTRQDMSNKSTE